MTLLDLSEAAELLRCSVRTVRRKIESGDLPAKQFSDGGKILVEQADVLALLRPVAAAAE